MLYRDLFISRGAEGPGREILQRPPSVRPSVHPSVCPSCLVFALQLENASMYFRETLQVRAPCHGGGGGAV